MRCGGNKTGATVYDLDESSEKYDRTGSPTMPHIVLIVLLAVVGLIAALAVWTSA